MNSSLPVKQGRNGVMASLSMRKIWHKRAYAVSGTPSRYCVRWQEIWEVCGKGTDNEWCCTKDFELYLKYSDESVKGFKSNEMILLASQRCLWWQ